MANNHKVGLNLPRVSANFFSGLTSHHLCDRIKSELFQSGNALIEHVREGVFHLNGGPA